MLSPSQHTQDTLHNLNRHRTPLLFADTAAHTMYLLQFAAYRFRIRRRYR